MQKKRRKDFFPKQQAEQIDYLKYFAAAFTRLAVQFGFTIAESDEMTVQANKCETDLADKLAKQEAAQTAAARFKGTLKVAEKLVRSIAARFKSHLDYTEEVGQDLDIIGEEVIIDTDDMKPELEVATAGDMPTIKWIKGQSQGINLFSKRGTEEAFTFLALDTVSPYHDTRPNIDPNKPETRQYYAFYVIEDAQVGIRSDIKSLTVGD